MTAPRSHDYFPIHQRHAEDFVPALPGHITLAVRLANGTYYDFHATETNDLRALLLAVARGETGDLPPMLGEYLRRFQCYVRYLAHEGVAPPGTASAPIAAAPGDPAAPFRMLGVN